ncbi:hypothetical protein OGR47_01560 [Methylocystis sp. MJC1]|jgi:uncharacterized Fe-S cluster-containing radical SAM superfamily enzyme|uniref:hypothetical protein n=1 Tax=Methylocystis sp. MJC1 TaxID=2654282 RepID=UPI0013EA4B96|nr:hypothetical protein [Methylocystis sp. MJC1]KAF2990639.1 hypothetical protein MJC1_02402 [Methylocystis sp. MJC1]MBU6525699.1 hypothetical protein [Methylocystis sp. MJC1]UZX12171.1 hypothetical protein OGR47_01560 [Methylocystis sp. MJC1]
MQTMTQLKAMHDQMMADLGNLPQYRALKAIDRFIQEMNEIHGVQRVSSENVATTLQQKLAAAIESRVLNEQQSDAQPRVTPFVPGTKVA